MASERGHDLLHTAIYPHNPVHNNQLPRTRNGVTVLEYMVQRWRTNANIFSIYRTTGIRNVEYIYGIYYWFGRRIKCAILGSEYE